MLSESTSGQQASGSATMAETKIEVVIGPSPAWIEVEADGKSIFSGLVLPGATQAFTGKQQIKLKTGNAGSTRVLLHGVDQGLLGDEGEVVEKTYRR